MVSRATSVPGSAWACSEASLAPGSSWSGEDSPAPPTGWSVGRLGLVGWSVGRSVGRGWGGVGKRPWAGL